MKRVLSGVLAAVLAVAAPAALAQSKPPLKLGGILDMSGLYADITGPGSETAAKMAAEDFGGEVLGRKIEIIAADHLNKADLAANIARDMFDNQGVEMIFDVAASATALAAGEIAKARNKIIMFYGPGIDPAQQRSLRSLYRALCVRHLRAGQCDRACRGQAGPRHLVLPHRRLRVRTGSGKGHHQCGAEVRRQGAGQRPASAQHLGFLVLSAAGAGLEGQGDRARQCRRRHHQRDQAGRRIRHHEGRPEDVAAARLRHRYRQRRARDRAGAVARRSVLLGPQRRDPRLFQALHGADEAGADLGAGRRLFIGAALSAGGEGRGHHRLRRRHEDHEGHPDQRHVRQERPDSRRRPHGARHVSVRGQEAVGIQGPLGRLQAARRPFPATRRSSRSNCRAARW